MKELVEYIARALVSDPAQVSVESYDGASGVTIALTVADEDKGRVIGRGGRIVNAMRALLEVISEREVVRVKLDIR